MTRLLTLPALRSARLHLAFAVLLAGAGCRNEPLGSGTGPGPIPPSALVWEQTAAMPGGGIVAIKANSFGMIFAADESGFLHRSTDLGTGWVTLPAAAGGVITSLASTGTLLVAGNGTHGIFLSSDNGESWAAGDSGLEDRQISALVALPNGHLYAGTVAGRLYRSVSGGSSWIGQANVARMIVSLCVSSTGTVLLSAWDHGLYRFTESSPALLPADAGLNDPYVMALAAGDAGYLYAGTLDRGLYRSVGAGASWQFLERCPAAAVRSVLALPGGGVLAGSTAGAFISYDNGASWARADSGLGDAVAGSFAVTPSGRLFAGTDRGVFRSAASLSQPFAHP